MPVNVDRVTVSEEDLVVVLRPVFQSIHVLP
jgi:hypothetical protein